MNKQTKMLLEEGFTVIYDATNISLKRRTSLLKTIPRGVQREAHYIPVSLEKAIKRDAYRPDTVGKDVIEKMYKNLDVPMVFEDFNQIKYVDQDTNFIYTPLEVVSKSVMMFKMLELFDTYDIYKEYFLTGEMAKCIDFAQDNPHHTFSVSKHMYEAIEKIKKVCSTPNTIIATALHDCGKPYCRFYGEDGYARFYGHEKVSAQMAVEFLMDRDVDSYDIAHITTLIALHMRMHQEKGKDKLFRMVGEDMFYELMIINEADSTAK